MEELLSFLPASRSLSSGEDRLYFTTDEGKLYGRGCRDETVRLITLPWPIRMVSFNGRSTSVLTYAGKVYSWRDSSEAIDTTPIPKLQELASPVVSISAGWESVMAVTVDGSLYALSHHSPVLVDLPLACHSVICLKHINHAITIDGSLYRWGKDGLIRPHERINTSYSDTPFKVEFEEPVCMVSVGNRHALMLTVSGMVYGYGDNHYGQLGSLIDQTIDTPVLVVLPSPCKLIACGSYHSFAVLETGELYGCGESTAGELGVVSYGVRPPKLVDTRKDISLMDGSYSHSLMMTSGGQVYYTGVLMGEDDIERVSGFTEVVL